MMEWAEKGSAPCLQLDYLSPVRGIDQYSENINLLS